MEQTTRVTKTTTAQNTPNAQVVDRQVTTSVEPDSQEFTIAKSNQIIWYIAHFIAIMTALRFVFLLLGAQRTGFVSIIYALTDLFVAPFRGIFPATAEGVSYFDTASLLAILMYYLLAFLITQAIVLMSKRTEA